MLADYISYRMAYWATDTITLGTWETASSILAVGLTWREAIPIVSLFDISLYDLDISSAIRPKLKNAKDDSRNDLRCNSRGAQRGHRCQISHPIFSSNSSIFWILFCIFLYCFEIYTGDVLVGYSKCGRSTVCYDYDIGYLA